MPDRLPVLSHVFPRPDGRPEIDDTGEASLLFGCLLDNWCILTNGHPGECDDQRENFDWERRYETNEEDSNA